MSQIALSEILQEMGWPEDLATLVDVSEAQRERMNKALMDSDGKAIAHSDEDEKSEYLLFLGRNEIASVAATINERWEAENWEAIEKALKKSSAKEKKKEAAKKASKELKESFARILNGGKAVDVALFGRMLADTPPSGGDRCSCIESTLIRAAGRRDATCPTLINFIPLCAGPSACKTGNVLKVNSCGGSSRRPMSRGVRESCCRAGRYRTGRESACKDGWQRLIQQST